MPRETTKAATRHTCGHRAALDPPDRKGRVTVTMNWHDANTTTMTLEADEWARLQPVMRTFSDAIAAAR